MFRAGSDNLGVVWLDAHTDINTEETSETNNKHGMVVSGLLGVQSFWGERVSEEYALSPKNIVYVGARDIDAPEMEIIKGLGIKVYTTSDVKQLGIENVMETVLYEDLGHVPRLHLSFDVDVMDPKMFPCTGTPVPHGLTYSETRSVMKSMRHDSRFWSMDVVEFNPEFSLNEFCMNDCAGTCTEMILGSFTDM